MTWCCVIGWVALLLRCVRACTPFCWNRAHGRCSSWESRRTSLLGHLLVCLFASPPVRFDAGVLVCSLASLCLQRHGGERESVCEREGKLGLLLAVRLVVRTKAWLAACLGGQVAGWPARCLLIACLPSAVSHLLCASDTQKERDRERERERETEIKREREREGEGEGEGGRAAHGGNPDVFEGLPCGRFAG